MTSAPPVCASRTPTLLVLHLDARPAETDLLVDSVPEAIARFTAAGGRLLHGPFPIRIGLCAVLADPWDNPLVILNASAGLLHTDDAGRIVPAPDESA